MLTKLMRPARRVVSRPPRALRSGTGLKLNATTGALIPSNALSPSSSRSALGTDPMLPCTITLPMPMSEVIVRMLPPTTWMPVVC